ncbi:MAG: hemolysin [Zetaproteobacteria bacterium]|nr:hemolysin [Pseudobdellovibrionaceae bacterium]
MGCLTSYAAQDETLTLLIIYLVLAIGVSFLCSIAEAVILRITPSYIAIAIREKHRYAKGLQEMQLEIDRPLAAILTLNTIAHTVGAAGTGAQATKVFGDGYLGFISAVLTFLILVVSEIIPKTLGAKYWKTFAPSTAYCLHKLIFILQPFLYFASLITRSLAGHEHKRSPNREEFLALAELSVEEDQLEPDEFAMVHSMLKIHKVKLQKILTPRTVVFTLDSKLTVNEFIEQHSRIRFSRIPIYEETHEELVGFVLLADILKAKVAGNGAKPLSFYARKIATIPKGTTVLMAFRKAIAEKTQIIAVIDEHGGLSGIVTLEDIVETILGYEIVDEGDTVADMQQLARLLWQHRRGS